MTDFKRPQPQNVYDDQRLPDDEAIRRRPDWIHELRRPIFLLVRARKPVDMLPA